MVELCGSPEGLRHLLLRRFIRKSEKIHIRPEQNPKIPLLKSLQ